MMRSNPVCPPMARGRKNPRRVKIIAPFVRNDQDGRNEPAPYAFRCELYKMEIGETVVEHVEENPGTGAF